MNAVNDNNVVVPNWFYDGDGAKVFIPIAEATGMQIDQINLLVCQLLALICAYFFRVSIPPHESSVMSRHLTSLSLGLGLLYFCFGRQIIILLSLLVVCYLVLIYLPPNMLHHFTLILSIGILSVMHIRRQLFENGLFVLDITGPLMIIVQKVSTLAYSVSDFFTKDRSQLTSLQHKYLIRGRPSLLEYFSYTLNFHSILVGPFFMFSEYKDFIEGFNYMKREESTNSNRLYDNNENMSNRDDQKRPLQLNPFYPSMGKMLIAIICGLITVTVIPHYPITLLAEPAFFAASFIEKNFYILLTTSLTRFKYYTAWTLGDAVCTMSGLGFNGFDDKGRAKWDLISNVDIWTVELGLNLHSTIAAWNIGTLKWLRFLVYERVYFQKTVFTYFLSCIWHGFYPGYYFTFMAGAMFTFVGRQLRKSIRPRILEKGGLSKKIYDVVTVAGARITLAYMTFPFVILRFWQSLNIYVSIYFYLHILGISSICLLPFVLPVPKQGRKEKMVGERVEDLKQD